MSIGDQFFETRNGNVGFMFETVSEMFVKHMIANHLEVKPCEDVELISIVACTGKVNNEVGQLEHYNYPRRECN